MFHLNENPENRFYLVSVVILASRSLTTDFCLLINFVVDDDCRKRISLAERLVTYMYLDANPEVFLYLKTRPLLTLMLITSNRDFVLQSIAGRFVFDLV